MSQSREQTNPIHHYGLFGALRGLEKEEGKMDMDRIGCVEWCGWGNR